jgi:hypothetical protein
MSDTNVESWTNRLFSEWSSLWFSLVLPWEYWGTILKQASSKSSPVPPLPANHLTWRLTTSVLYTLTLNNLWTNWSRWWFCPSLVWDVEQVPCNLSSTGSMDIFEVCFLSTKQLLICMMYTELESSNAKLRTQIASIKNPDLRTIEYEISFNVRMTVRSLHSAWSQRYRVSITKYVEKL